MTTQVKMQMTTPNGNPLVTTPDDNTDNNKVYNPVDNIR
jgi:hypothetical protein